MEDPIPGYGSASPSFGDKVFMLTAINTKSRPSLPKPEDQPKRIFGITYPNTEHVFVVMCLDRKTGKTLWQQVATQLIPHEGTHEITTLLRDHPPLMENGSTAGSAKRTLLLRSQWENCGTPYE